jgi:hypothetical protein
MKSENNLLCPSHRCKPGSQLLGVRQDDGTVAILPTPLPIDDDFISKVRQDEMAPEQRFRFTNKCVASGCNQWTGKGCGVVERIVQHLDDLPSIINLPACGIRDKCRWYRQRKADACKACPFIITEITVEQILELQTTDLPLSEG